MAWTPPALKSADEITRAEFRAFWLKYKELSNDGHPVLEHACTVEAAMAAGWFDGWAGADLDSLPARELVLLSKQVDAVYKAITSAGEDPK